MLLQATFGTLNSAITKHFGVEKALGHPSRTEPSNQHLCASDSPLRMYLEGPQKVLKRSSKGPQTELQTSNYACAVAYTPQKLGNMHLFYVPWMTSNYHYLHFNSTKDKDNHLAVVHPTNYGPCGGMCSSQDFRGGSGKALSTFEAE